MNRIGILKSDDRIDNLKLLLIDFIDIMLHNNRSFIYYKRDLITTSSSLDTEIRYELWFKELEPIYITIQPRLTIKIFNKRYNSRILIVDTITNEYLNKICKFFRNFICNLDYYYILENLLFNSEKEEKYIYLNINKVYYETYIWYDKEIELNDNYILDNILYVGHYTFKKDNIEINYEIKTNEGYNNNFGVIIKGILFNRLWFNNEVKFNTCNLTLRKFLHPYNLKKFLPYLKYLKNSEIELINHYDIVKFKYNKYKKYNYNILINKYK